MEVKRRIEVPTGHILIVSGEYGDLEMLSLGDYGKEVNVKASFLGLDRTPPPVAHRSMLPLEEKWVVTVSTQYGCSMGCSFCDVPKVGPGINATFEDLVGQVEAGLSLHPEVERTERLNIHFARMGEPTFNRSVLNATIWLAGRYGGTHRIHPVVSTMMPHSNGKLRDFIRSWVYIKNELLGGNAGLQLSINSTDRAEREAMFPALTLRQIGDVMSGLRPKGRKFALNFAVAGYTIDPGELLKHFSPDDYMIKLTPMHKTARCVEKDIKTDGDYTTYEPYEQHEKALVEAGYDVLVFIASREEDEGRITCGNAILSGTEPFGAGMRRQNEWNGAGEE